MNWHGSKTVDIFLAYACNVLLRIRTIASNLSLVEFDLRVLNLTGRWQIPKVYQMIQRINDQTAMSFPISAYPFKSKEMSNFLRPKSIKTSINNKTHRKRTSIKSILKKILSQIVPQVFYWPWLFRGSYGTCNVSSSISKQGVLQSMQCCCWK